MLLVVLAFSVAVSCPSPSTTVAIGRQDLVRQADVDEWRCYRRADRGRARDTDPASVARQIVLLRELERIHLADAAAVASGRLREELLAQRLASRGLKRRLRIEDDEHEEEQLADILDEERDRLSRPRRYRLENIFKRVAKDAPATEWERVARQLEELRRRILAGEPFAKLALAESDSETKRRGGRMGVVAEERLAPEVKKALSGLSSGDVTHPVRGPEGLSILRLVESFEPRVPDERETRTRGLARIRERSQETRWSELGARLLREAAPELHPERLVAGAPGDTVVATWRHSPSGPRRGITLALLEASLAERDFPVAALLPEGQRKEQLSSLVLAAALLEEAVREGLTAEPEYELVLRWRLRELHAAIAARDIAGRMVEPPDESETRRTYDRFAERLKPPQEMKLREIRLPVDGTQSREFYERVRTTGEQAASGAITFDEARTRIGDVASYRELPWLSEQQLWLRGPALFRAVKELPPGGVTPAVQEGATIYLVEMVARKDGVRPPYEEARPRVREALLARRQKAAVAQVRAALDAAADVAIVSP